MSHNAKADGPPGHALLEALVGFRQQLQGLVSGHAELAGALADGRVGVPVLRVARVVLLLWVQYSVHVARGEGGTYRAHELAVLQDVRGSDLVVVPRVTRFVVQCGVAREKLSEEFESTNA